MSRAIQAVRGMNDLLPDALGLWQRAEQCASGVLHSYGYREIRLPLLEKTELYVRSIGQVTDIVEKEMYTFEDRNGESLSLRPEGTAGCVRAGIENGLLHNQIQRFWYAGPMFRHERPQRGRYRQFYQIGVEAFGMSAPELDAELILMGARLWRSLKVHDVVLQLNSLGTPACRASYRRLLVDYLEEHRTVLDEDSLRRLHSNPLRVLDSKNPALQGVIERAPSLLDHLDPESAAHFDRLRSLLDDAGVGYVVNPRLVRGLDYYTRTVFEWVSSALGAQATICAGGRYDGLVEQLGGRATPAAGFAIGMERVVELLAQQELATETGRSQLYMVLLGELAQRRGALLAERLRDDGIAVECDAAGGSLKSQMRRADRSGAVYAVLIGDAEISAGLVSIKSLRSEGPQEQIPEGSLAQALKQRLVC
ncbi:MAG: histidine--tRNA ligase [Gammaproteobacteria bacterium]|nr:histidine--tRNA ligase [Gammaproteobacteria bacterium]